MSRQEAEVRAPESGHFALLKRPILTEKTARMGALVFSVDPRAGKSEIKEAVERIFKVEVASVRTATYSGKPKRAGRSVGRRSGYKKAYITLKEGYQVDLVEGV